MTPFSAIVSVTVRGLLGRRRLFLMLALASIPILLGAIVQVRGGRADVERVLAILVVQTVMPIVALILGTASLGPEIEDGTVVYLLTKPIRRWLVALAKIVVAVGVTALARGAGHDRDRAPGRRRAGRRPRDHVGLRRGLPGRWSGVRGGVRRAEHDDGRALVIGLVYVLIWEGALGELLEGTRFLSIRQATLGIVAGLGGDVDSEAPLQIGVAAVVLTVAVIGSLLLTSWRLARFEVRAGD